MSRLRVSSGGPWEDRVGYSRAIRVGDHIWVAGTTGTHPDGTTPEGAAAQTRLALDTIEQALRDAGGTIEDVVVARTYVVDIDEWEQVADGLRDRFANVRPAMTMVEVSRLMAPAHRVEIDVEAIVNSGDE